MKKLNTRNFIVRTVICICLLNFTAATALAETSGAPVEKKIGVLLVSHGSRSATWRQALLDLEARVRPTLLTNTAVQGIKTAFMEYTEPSIATRLKEFDAEAFTDVIIVPVFLTVSPHTFDDIPTIIGKKVDPHSLELLKLENIERYNARANTVITPNLDFTDVLKKNVLRRVKSLSTNPSEESLVMIAYGDATYEKQWAALLDAVGEHVKQNTGVETYGYGWCGHVAHYDPKNTTEAIERVLQRKKKAVVIPVLVAQDEMFQIKIIGDGIAKVPENQMRVIYRPDSILPDPNIEQWVTDITGEYAAKVRAQSPVTANR